MAYPVTDPDRTPTGGIWKRIADALGEYSGYSKYVVGFGYAYEGHFLLIGIGGAPDFPSSSEDELDSWKAGVSRASKERFDAEMVPTGKGAYSEWRIMIHGAEDGGIGEGVGSVAEDVAGLVEWYKKIVKG